MSLSLPKAQVSPVVRNIAFLLVGLLLFPQSAIASSGRGLIKAYDFLFSNEPRRERELIRRIIPSVIPLESQRASAFLVRFSDKADTLALVSAAHSLASEMDHSANDRSRKLGVSFDPLVDSSPAVTFPFNGLTEYLTVNLAPGDGVAQILFVPKQSRKRLLDRTMDPNEDYSISQVVKWTEGQLSIPNPLEIASRPPEKGEPVFLLGFPGVSREPRKLAVSRGKILSREEAIEAIQYVGGKAPSEGSHLLYTNALAIKGMSGGVAVNRDGKVVGIIQGGYFSPNLSIVDALNRKEITTQLISIHAVLKRLSGLSCSTMLMP